MELNVHLFEFQSNMESSREMYKSFHQLKPIPKNRDGPKYSVNWKNFNEKFPQHT